MGVLNSLIGFMSGLINIGKIEEIAQQETSVTAIMETAMERWLMEYIERPYWLDDHTEHSIGIAGMIAQEVSRLTLLEFEFKSIGTSDRAKWLCEQIEHSLDNLDDNLEFALAMGGMFAKPYVKPNGDLGIDWIMQNNVYPLTDGCGEVIGAVFLSFKNIGDYIYTRLEVHKQDLS